MKPWVIILIVVLAILITTFIAFMVNKAKLKKAVEAGKIEINKQSYTLVKVVNTITLNKTELTKVANADGTTTVTYSDGSTAILPKI